jgi:ribosomal protein S18 acetylase RimI-like enzyme
MLTIRELGRDEVDRIREVDVSETGRLVYRYRDGRIEGESENWERPRWSQDHAADHVRGAVEVLDARGSLWGAFDGDTLVGYALLRFGLTDRQAQLADLQVSRAHRRTGVARRLVEQTIRLAREDGAREMYVSSCPSESAVGFYRSLGFGLAREVDRELFALEPEDIHMTRPL